MSSNSWQQPRFSEPKATWVIPLNSCLPAYLRDCSVQLTFRSSWIDTHRSPAFWTFLRTLSLPLPHWGLSRSWISSWKILNNWSTLILYLNHNMLLSQVWADAVRKLRVDYFQKYFCLNEPQSLTDYSSIVYPAILHMKCNSNIFEHLLYARH